MPATMTARETGTRPRQPSPWDARLDWAMVGASAWILGGAYLDAWAHTHFPELETFFTPWHAVLYSGLLAATVVLGATALRGRPARPWGEALPPGYGLSALGVVLFAVGGASDLLWHEVFGIEADVEALLSPTHLVLAVGTTLIGTGPLRAAWRQPAEAGRSLWPAVCSLAFLLSSLTFWTQYMHPLARPWAAGGNRPTVDPFPVAAPDPLFQGSDIGSVFVAQALGLASIVLQALVLTGLLLFAVRRRGPALPAGSVTLILATNALLVGGMRDELVLAPFAAMAGLAGDTALARLRPAAERPTAFRLFALLVPVIYYALYVLGLALVKSVWWPASLWSGAIVSAGLAGWLLSYLALPPASPAAIRT
jgi:hypothetical protein